MTSYILNEYCKFCGVQIREMDVNGTLLESGLLPAAEVDVNGTLLESGLLPVAIAMTVADLVATALMVVLSIFLQGMYVTAYPMHTAF